MRRGGISASSLLVVAALSVAGCSDDEPLKPKPTVDTSQASPQNTLATYVTTYQSRDSVGIAGLYDPSYVGSSTDFSEPPGSQTISFTMADEVAHVAALRRASSIQSVVLDLGPQLSWTRLASDDVAHPEWAQIEISNFVLEIFDGPDLFSASSGAGDLMTFRFSPQPDTGSATDTTWRIVGWTEVRGAIP